MAALGDKNHLAGAGSDGAGLGVHGEAALDDIVNLVIAGKGEVEKIREQVQNIE